MLRQSVHHDTIYAYFGLENEMPDKVIAAIQISRLLLLLICIRNFEPNYEGSLEQK